MCVVVPLPVAKVSLPPTQPAALARSISTGSSALNRRCTSSVCLGRCGQRGLDPVLLDGSPAAALVEVGHVRPQERVHEPLRGCVQRERPQQLAGEAPAAKRACRYDVADTRHVSRDTVKVDPTVEEAEVCRQSPVNLNHP